MVKISGTVGVLFLLMGQGLCYDESPGNLFSPSPIPAPAAELTFQHRFTRSIGEPSYTLLGGATVDAGIIARIWKGFSASVDFYVPNDEFDFGGSYSHYFGGNRFGAYGTAHFFNLKEPLAQSRVSDMLYAGALTWQAWNEQLWIICNASFDGYAHLLVPSAGFLYRVTDAFDILGEYCFGHDTTQNIRNSFSFGVKLNTSRHQFKVLLSNSTGTGGRSFIAGARDNRVRFGFSIQRLFDF